ncbi:protein of unknown function [Candidatus Nitrosacidococcus tergens]|uniref:Uncharacterized protein n=1 Tax=Candidatus Nitrosacidococcus tergens TaxID=553981 RepID=A0A7G1QAI2_9GAMM|nr:protein of unknown function [Candidatus Nitrosacidococcus tergens]
MFKTKVKAEYPAGVEFILSLNMI